jgi:thiol-disulfide isomerase/thioredoxin
MGDRIAAFLFDSAVVLMPALVLLGTIAVVLLVRRWPRSLWRRAARSIGIAAAIAVAGIASLLLYAERNIRSIIQHRVQVLKLHPKKGSGPRSVADLRGNVVVVNFWATWCPPCRDEMPDLNKLADQYSARRVAVLTITDETPDRIALYERKIIALRTIVATFESDRPTGALAGAAYQGRPTTLVLDRDGVVRQIFIGRQSFDRLRRAVEKELSRSPAAEAVADRSV